MPQNGRVLNGGNKLCEPDSGILDDRGATSFGCQQECVVCSKIDRAVKALTVTSCRSPIFAQPASTSSPIATSNWSSKRRSSSANTKSNSSFASLSRSRCVSSFLLLNEAKRPPFDREMNRATPGVPEPVREQEQLGSDEDIYFGAEKARETGEFAVLTFA